MRALALVLAGSSFLGSSGLPDRGLGQGKQACDGRHFVPKPVQGLVQWECSAPPRAGVPAWLATPWACPPSLAWRDPALPYLGFQQKLRPQLQ